MSELQGAGIASRLCSHLIFIMPMGSSFFLINMVFYLILYFYIVEATLLQFSNPVGTDSGYGNTRFLLFFF